MIKTCKFVVIALLAILLNSCGEKEYDITPTSTKVNGPLGEYFAVVDRSYKLADGKVSIEFKRIAEGGPKDASWNSEPTFTVELTDESGNTIDSKSTSVVWNKEQLEALFNLGVDETASVTFDFRDYKGAAKFKVSSKWDEKKSTESSSSEFTPEAGSEVTPEAGSSASASSGSSSNWDATLDSYESYVNQYIALMKKAMSGDISAMSEYPSLLQKAEDLSDKLSNAENDMTASQRSRYLKITNKLTQAASSL